MPTPISRTARNRPNPKENPELNRPAPDSSGLIISADASGTTLTLTFDKAVTLAGTPGITTDVAGTAPISAEQTAPNVVAITFDGSIDLATSLTIPPRDRGIRTSSGGYVISNVFPLAA